MPWSSFQISPTSIFILKLRTRYFLFSQLSGFQVTETLYFCFLFFFFFYCSWFIILGRVSGVQQSDSVTYIHVCILFTHDVSQDIEYPSRAVEQDLIAQPFSIDNSLRLLIPNSKSISASHPPPTPLPSTSLRLWRTLFLLLTLHSLIPMATQQLELAWAREWGW